ncbi:MAG: sensor histidine kinase [Chloroflexota bacterium]
MARPLEENLLRTFRLFIIIRLILAIATVALNDDVMTLVTYSLLIIAISLSLLLYLSIEQLERWLCSFYLPIAIAIISIQLIIEQRILQFRLSQVNAELIRDLPEFLEALTLSGIENTTAPLLFTLGATALLFVPLVLMSWQYRFRYIVLYVVLITVLDVMLITFARQFVRFDAPIEVVITLIRTVSFLIVGYIVTKIMQTQREQRLVLTTLNQDLMAYATTREQLIISQERNRLARELHDTLAHTLSAITVKLNAVQVLWDNDNDERAKIMLTEVIGTLNEGNAETRRALQDLRASPLEDMGLILAIRHLAETSIERGGFELDLHLPEQELRLRSDVEQVVYRITQEALANVVEHANANKVSLTLSVQEACLKLTISDDGVGFNPKEPDPKRNFGLVGMVERSKMIGGTLSVTSQVGTGTTIQLTVERLP